MAEFLRNFYLVTNVAALVLMAAGVVGLERYRRPWLEVMRGLRLRHFAANFPVLYLIVVVAQALETVPLLRFGWWTMIGGVGNPGLGTTEGGAAGWPVNIGRARILVRPALG